MSRYTFDIPLIASISVSADNPEAARQMLQTALDCADTNFGALPNGDPILGECSLMEDIDIYRHLGMIDGVDSVNQFGRMMV
jgi:hypothetical protein